MTVWVAKVRALDWRVWLLCIVLMLAGAAIRMPEAPLSVAVLQAPSRAHWLGTDMLGRDVLLTVFKALPNTLLITLATGVLPVLFALLLTAFSYALGGVGAAQLT